MKENKLGEAIMLVEEAMEVLNLKGLEDLNRAS